MTATFLYSMVGVLLFAMGLYGLIFQWHLLKKILAVNIMCSGVFLVFIAGKHRTAGLVDPVPQALVLTGIVIAVSTTALALALACSIMAARKTPRPSAGSQGEDESAN